MYNYTIVQKRRNKMKENWLRNTHTFCTAQICKFQLKIANVFSRLNFEFLIFFVMFLVNFACFLRFFLIVWISRPCECAYVALMAVFRRQGERACEKKWSRKWYRRFLSVKSLIDRFYWEETRVPMWGKAGQSAGPPKSAGKKRDRRKWSPLSSQ